MTGIQGSTLTVGNEYYSISGTCAVKHATAPQLKEMNTR